MSEGKMVAPKFLTREICEYAVTRILEMVERLDGPFHYVKLHDGRPNCHIVILVPSMKDDRATDYPDWPRYALEPIALYEHSSGDTNEWRHSYKDIARCKALQLWHERNDGGTDVLPHLLFSGDTPYWGGVKRDGIVVACSGFESWLDRMIAGMIADACIGTAYDAWMISDERFNREDFLP